MLLRLLYLFADLVLYPLLCYVVRYRRRVVRQNLLRSFPEMDERERRRLMRRFYRQFATEIAEMAYGLFISEEEMAQRVQMTNIELVNSLTRKYGGSIVMLSHTGCWEWMASLQQHVDKDIVECNVYRELKNKRMDRLMLRLRARRGGFCCEKNRLLRQMVKQRSEHQLTIYGMLADQKPSPNNMHFWTTFLHQDTSFLDGSEVLARKFRYPVFFMFITSPRRGYYHVDLRLLAEEVGALDEFELTGRYVRVLEQNILEQPHLWLWTHNRWKWRRQDIPQGLRTNITETQPASTEQTNPQP